ncbi:hypothetical protein ATANTOWER_010010 [Ataeniobius toweri]|uniref:Uncharacterized protein n=1 Tax=Ataeniobius toweri TaxID=208326 RepID=A0ABU7B8E5_9TELE|nr:hypothetical protein [Ataeniobius toweri]
MRYGPDAFFSRLWGKSTSIRAASGNLRRKVKPHLSYYILFMNECWSHEQQNQYLTLLHTISMIIVIFGFKLKSDVCLPARRHSRVVPLLSDSRLKPAWKEAAMLEHSIFVQL